jgi:hypothetical protein
VYKHAYFSNAQKHTKLINQIKIITKEKIKRKEKKYLHNIQGWRSGKVSFQDLAVHRVGV